MNPYVTQKVTQKLEEDRMERIRFNASRYIIYYVANGRYRFYQHEAFQKSTDAVYAWTNFMANAKSFHTEHEAWEFAEAHAKETLLNSDYLKDKPLKVAIGNTLSVGDL